MNNTFHYMLEYLPKRFQATSNQEEDRQTVYSFKNGRINANILNFFLDKIKSIAGASTEWTICFMPASTKEKTAIRYAKLAKFLKEQSKCEVNLSAIYNEYDREAGHIAGKCTDPISSFGFSRSEVSGKKIILVDDVFTRGVTYRAAEAKFKQLGAVDVKGLFLAKTINPDWKNNLYNENYTDAIEDGEWQDEEYPIEEDFLEEETYENYNYSYAQSEEGWSDQDIDEVLDGDPDAYWNID